MHWDALEFSLWPYIGFVYTFIFDKPSLMWSCFPLPLPPQLKKIRSLLVAGATDYDCFYQHLRLLDGSFKLSAKDLRSQVVREACITVAWVSDWHLEQCEAMCAYLFSINLEVWIWRRVDKLLERSHFYLFCVHGKEHQFTVLCLCRYLSTLLGNKFDHGAEGIVPVLFNLIPNCAKVMATSGTAAIRIIIRVRNGGVQEFILSDCTVSVCFDCLFLYFQHTHVPRLIPLIASNCTSKSVAVRRWDVKSASTHYSWTLQEYY